MTYERINFVDQSVERPRTYEMTYNSDGSVTLVDSFGLVDELGTPINADTMNHIEDGIAATAIRKYNANETFALNEWVLATVANETNFYKSLKDNNLGNPLTDTNYWEVVKIGSGASREVGEFVRGFWSADYVPENLLYCDGAEFSGAEGQMFRNMWTDYILTGKLDTCSYAEYETELTMTGSCYKWAVDTANQKFRIPSIPDKVLVDIADILPVNMTGFDTSNLKMTVSHNGYGGNMNFVVTETGVSSGSHLDFEVNTTNTKTYKTIRHFVVVATGSINQSEADWSEFASSLASKANNDLSNVEASQSFIDKSMDWGAPDYSAGVSISAMPLSSSPYTAPYDGYYILSAVTSGSTVINAYINDVQTPYLFRCNNTALCANTVPIRLSKGDVLYWSGTMSTILGQAFYPLKGAN